VLWLAREGTYIRESKDSKLATEKIIEAINQMLFMILKSGFVSTQTNEPMDHSYIPTTATQLPYRSFAPIPNELV